MPIFPYAEGDHRRQGFGRCSRTGLLKAAHSNGSALQRTHQTWAEGMSAPVGAVLHVVEPLVVAVIDQKMKPSQLMSGQRAMRLATTIS